eukprot:CAMPEP_0171984054 /NCGR_PEP_ID=MMETSP0993-20121228/273625_1 /TAXON_ID=483369 /ORGANISM="non described non described, Strain CCMP2098" /LENGTH=35 /DNA_ID= /DNA_START= /DNA_END= /DNA_ORIENTATION=
MEPLLSPVPVAVVEPPSFKGIPEPTERNGDSNSTG